VKVAPPYKFFKVFILRNVLTSGTKIFNITFRFPSDAELRQKWLEKIPNLNFKPTLWSVVCSLHFSEDCFDQKEKRRDLKNGAVPVIFNEQKIKEIQPEGVIIKKNQIVSVKITDVYMSYDYLYFI
jgi:hypothetical protein